MYIPFEWVDNQPLINGRLLVWYVDNEGETKTLIL